MLTYEELKKITQNCHKKFYYYSDINNYGVREHWPLYEEIDDDEVLYDDCDGFAQKVRKELHKLGEKSIIQAVGVNSAYMNHAVCRYGDWMMDNTHRNPMRREDITGWTYVMHSDESETCDKWYKTVVVDDEESEVEVKPLEG